MKRRIDRQGPLCVALNFQNGGKGPAWQVEMTFPSSKSWVEVSWTADDRAPGLESMTADLNLLVGEAPALVDFGAGSLVYTTLPKGESAVLRAGGKKRWETLVGPAAALRPLVVPPPTSTSQAEGWAHLMDRQRCTAAAVADFAASGCEDEVRTDGDGRLVLTRRLRFWQPVSAPDAELVRRFVSDRDEAAFAALVDRHGTMVLGTARRVVGDLHTAEDVFQATFVTLARHAHHLRHPAALPAWLHRTACSLARTAVRAHGRCRAEARAAPARAGGS